MHGSQLDDHLRAPAEAGTIEAPARVAARRGDRSPGSWTKVWLVVGLVLMAGAGLRMVHANDPMLEWFPTRQYMSVDLAWKYDLALGAPASPGDSDAAAVRSETEPPVMEGATALIWRAMGDRPLWVPRLLTVLIWSAGGVAMALLLRRLAASAVGVVVGVVAWTFIPFVVQGTRVFQPDPLMIVAILSTVLAIVVDDDERTRKTLIIAGLVAGAAVFVKLPALFFVVTTYVAVTCFSRGVRALWSRRSLAFAAMACGPAVVWNLLGLVVFTYLRQKTGDFVYPRLALTGWFWDQWLSLVMVTFGGILVGMALVGIGVARGRTRIVGVGLVAGYVTYGLAFTWHYSTHHYYHLPLVMAVALGLGLLASEIEAMVRRRRADLLSVGVATVALIAFIGGFAYSLWGFVPPEANAASVHRNIEVAAQVGDVVGHRHALVLAEHNGYPLAYYGSVKNLEWPESDDLRFAAAHGAAPFSVEDRFDELQAQIHGEFFIVLDMPEWDEQPELQAFLRSRFPVVAETDEYLVFDLRSVEGNGG